MLKRCSSTLIIAGINDSTNAFNFSGQKLIEAGAKLQAEAAISGQGHEVKYNVHDTAKVKQQTCTATGAMATKGIETAQDEFVVRQTKPGYCR